MPLERYRQKRHFERTPEPRGTGEPRAEGGHGRFVVQMHAARRLHYDFRLEHGGVLWSWAIPKGPSADPSIKRLAVQTEDHPLEYSDFEGVIPKGEYGGGTVLVWDRGTWQPEGDPERGMAKGHLRFRLDGSKLRGSWSLVRTSGRGPRGDASPGEPDKRAWLLIKHQDAAARPGAPEALLEERPESVLTERTLDEVARDPDRVWHSDREAAPEVPLPDPAQLERAGRVTEPACPSPQLATLVSVPPAGDGWIHEIKLDGYRLLAVLQEGAARMRTRHGKDWTERMPSVARVLEALPVEAAVLDGELVVFQDNGISDFQRLQNSLSEGRDEACVYMAFDLLHLDGWDLQKVPVVERKALLKQLLEAAKVAPTRLRFSDHIQGHGTAFFQRACEMGLEGIVSKRADGVYRPGRGKDWVKIKCLGRQELVVVGYTDPGGSRTGLGALLLALYEGATLVYAGKVGTGFTERSLTELLAVLQPLERDEPAFARPPTGAEARGVHWVEPRLVAEVEFTGFTDDGRLRHPSFKGLRADKAPEDVVRERPEPRGSRGKASPSAGARAPAKPPAGARRQGGRANRGVVGDQPTGAAGDAGKVRLTNPDRIMYGAAGITKRELAEYYLDVAERMLPFVGARLLTLVRCPEGQGGECFYQKHHKDGMPEPIHPVPLQEKEGPVQYLRVESAAGLVALAQIGALELHVWGSRLQDLEHPDQLVFDLDPDPALGWSTVVEAARHVRDRLDALGLQSWVKTTGGKGLHVVVPIVPGDDWDGVKAFCKAVAEDLERAHPQRYLSNMAKAKRKGRIFVDYLRNGRGATAIAPYSTRARPGAPVATPLSWQELGATVGGAHYDLRNIRRRLAALEHDPWEGYLEVEQRITPAMKRALKVPGT